MADSGWAAAGAADQYRKLVDVVAPGWKEILNLIARLATSSGIQPHRIIDLGCGWGDVTNEILNLAPQASVLMLDYSQEMVNICKERFKDIPRVNVVQHDLNNGLGPYVERGFDAVVSCFALHHVEFENRVKLYTDIKTVLKESGIFVNADLFRCHSTFVNQWEFDAYVYWMSDQLKEKLGQEYTFAELKARQLENYHTMGDKPGTIWDMYTDMQLAGFQFIDCLCKHQNLAVLAASNR